MELHQALDAVRNDRVRFVTLRPTDTPFATLERRVVVTAPPELIELAQSGSIAALDALIALLTDPQRAWAAEVILAALTGQEAKIVDTFSTDPHGWWSSLGQTAQARWQEWLKNVRPKLVWDSTQHIFTAEV